MTNAIANVRELWLVVECPHCHAPQSFKKHILKNKVIALLKTRYMTCEQCGKSSFVEIEKYDKE